MPLHSARLLAPVGRGAARSALMMISTATLYYNDVYEVKLPEGHKFPMGKYRMVREELELWAASRPWVDFVRSPLATHEELFTTHHPDYVRGFIEGTLPAPMYRRIGFPYSPEQVLRILSSVGGCTAAARLLAEGALARRRDPSLPPWATPWVAGQIAGGTHHAYHDRGEGFCAFSDMAVAANAVLGGYHGAVGKVLFVDLDVHQGNGNAALFKDDDRVFTFSMHCSGNIFSQREVSDVDVEVEPGTDDETYLSTLGKWLDHLLPYVKPDLVMFQAGVDGLWCDRLGKLNLTPGGLSRRNVMVANACLSRAVPLLVLMGGGYPKDPTERASESFRAVVAAHSKSYSDVIEVAEGMGLLGRAAGEAAVSKGG